MIHISITLVRGRPCRGNQYQRPAVEEIATPPGVRLAALKVATNAVNTAQLVITQQAATLQTVLDTLAAELAMATDKQTTKQKTH